MDVGIVIDVDEDKSMIHVHLDQPCGGRLGLADVPTCHQDMPFGGRWHLSYALSPVVALSLRDVITDARRNGASVSYADPSDRIALKRVTMQNTPPTLDWDPSQKRIVAMFPQTARYRKIMRTVFASPRKDGSWSIPVTSINDLVALNESLPSGMRFTLSSDVDSLVHDGLPAPYDGTADSLRTLPTSVLRVVESNMQSYALRKANPMSIEEKLSIMGINSLYDLLMLRPQRYIDRSNPSDVRDLIEGETATIVGTVVEWRHPSQRLAVMDVKDRRDQPIQCSFFNAGRWFEDRYRPGDEVVLTGAYRPWKSYGGRVVAQLSQPQVDPLESAGAVPIMPVYRTPAKAALSSMIVMHCEQELISRLGDGFRGPAWADPALKSVHITTSYGDALKTMHFPPTGGDGGSATAALAFCEMVQLLVWIEAHRPAADSMEGVSNRNDGSMEEGYVRSLPYELTGAQRRDVDEIRKTMESSRPLRALLVGDVGSGKTTVMHLAALNAVAAGHQAVITAPTEILATQLYGVFMDVLRTMPKSIQGKIHPVLHAGYHGRGSTKARRATIDGVKDGSINMIFGTHGVLNLDYDDLSFVGVDEQHKFGVAQRSRLLTVRPDGKIPDFLMQTATPIPRSMAQVYYGDVQYLALDELPAGRQPIVTKWVQQKGTTVVEDPDNEIWKDCLSEMRKDHGVFVVCPMVSDSEKIDAASVRKTMKTLKDSMPADIHVEAVYGGQDRHRQDEIIMGFKNGDVDMLVASSVVEVGVSCEKATRMVILDANRFGLASLHQIRGRIGRSTLPSVCWLVAMPFNENGRTRLQAMVDTMDGWRLSKTDLRNRGTGSLFGTAQSGRSDLMFANLVRDAQWIDPARKVARSLVDGSESERMVEDARRYFDIEENDENDKISENAG